MTAIKLTRQDFFRQLSEQMENFEIVAPVMTDGKVNYQVVSDMNQIRFTDELPVKSAKETVFPRVEALMKFADRQVSVIQKAKPILLIGVKPCDAEAFEVLDAVFAGKKWNLEDPFYEARRKLLTMIGMGCREEKRGCFCAARGIDKTFSGKCDGFLYEDEEGFIYEPISESGNGLLTGKEEKALIHENTPPPVTLQISAKEEDVFDTMPWEEYALGCIGCGTCTFVCPTCHCFALKDSEKNEQVVRSRIWDSCMYPGFTLHGGGHNPRNTKWARYRQRVLHKYVYIRDNFGKTACTGCGRCIRSCPGGINIRKIVEDIQLRLEVSEHE